jgi:hypothetical protein
VRRSAIASPDAFLPPRGWRLCSKQHNYLQ